MKWLINLIKIIDRAKHIKEIKKIYGSNNQCNNYATGFYNGLELATSILENREPEYKHTEPEIVIANLFDCNGNLK